MLTFVRDEPLFTETLKFSLYRSAAADLLDKTLAQTEEPWPKGYEMLEAMANRTISSRTRNDTSFGDSAGRPTENPATVSDLWVAQTKRTEFAKRILETWTATKRRSGTGREMDALLLPCSPWPASPK